jgi:hypothetical protein
VNRAPAGRARARHVQRDGAHARLLPFGHVPVPARARLSQLGLVVVGAVEGGGKELARKQTI